MIRCLAIVGLGLLGGSLAKAVRGAGLAREIVGIGRRPAALEPARQAGVVDRIDLDVAAGVRGAEMVVLATPVTTLLGQLPTVWDTADADAVITDVGSTKARIVVCAEALGSRRPLAFVGGHPMAGSEQAGYEVSRPDLYRGALVILTPTERTDPAALKRVTELWEGVGARTTMLDPGQHDRAVAAVSHVPHLVADALVETVRRLDPSFFEVAGRGFRDATRIAAGSAEIWRDIFKENREALAEGLRVFRQAVDDLERVVADDDRAAAEALLAEIKRVREGLG